MVLLSAHVFISSFSKNLVKSLQLPGLGDITKLSVSVPEGNINMMSYGSKYHNHNHQGSREYLERERMRNPDVPV